MKLILLLSLILMVLFLSIIGCIDVDKNVDIYNNDIDVTPGQAQNICDVKCTELLGMPATWTGTGGNKDWCSTKTESFEVLRKDFGCQRGLTIVR